MDITLLPIEQAEKVGLHCCFNPCFNGYYTSTSNYNLSYSHTVLVSILVLMDITLLQLSLLETYQVEI